MDTVTIGVLRAISDAVTNDAMCATVNAATKSMLRAGVFAVTL
jgi:hypothetical protein